MSAPPFAPILARALSRHGAALQDRLPTPRSPDALAAIPDDRYLAEMTRRVFSAGFVWRVVDAKWDGFEAAFHGFEPSAVATLGSVAPGALLDDARVIRNPQKIRATFDNARFVLQTAEEHGSFGRFLADWPETDIVGLWDTLAARGSRLGGDTGPRFLRGMGKDTFILTPDVVAGLTELGVLTGKATSKTARRAAQETFLAWRAETGRGLGALSVILACSVDRSE